jgi:hypothetical protein
MRLRNKTSNTSKYKHPQTCLSISICNPCKAPSHRDAKVQQKIAPLDAGRVPEPSATVQSGEEPLSIKQDSAAMLDAVGDGAREGK